MTQPELDLLYAEYRTSFGISKKKDEHLAHALSLWEEQKIKSLFIYGIDARNPIRTHTYGAMCHFPLSQLEEKQKRIKKRIDWCIQKYGIDPSADHAQALSVLDMSVKEISCSLYLAPELKRDDTWNVFYNTPMRAMTMMALLTINPTIAVGGICVSICNSFGAHLLGYEGWLRTND